MMSGSSAAIARNRCDTLSHGFGNIAIVVSALGRTAWYADRIVPSETHGNGMQGPDSSRRAHQRHEQHQDTQAEVDRDPCANLRQGRTTGGPLGRCHGPAESLEKHKAD